MEITKHAVQDCVTYLQLHKHDEHKRHNNVVTIDNNHHKMKINLFAKSKDTGIKIFDLLGV